MCTPKARRIQQSVLATSCVVTRQLCIAPHATICGTRNRQVRTAVPRRRRTNVPQQTRNTIQFASRPPSLVIARGTCALGGTCACPAVRSFKLSARVLFSDVLRAAVSTKANSLQTLVATATTRLPRRALANDESKRASRLQSQFEACVSVCQCAHGDATRKPRADVAPIASSLRRAPFRLR